MKLFNPETSWLTYLLVSAVMLQKLQLHLSPGGIAACSKNQFLKAKVIDVEVRRDEPLPVILVQ